MSVDHIHLWKTLDSNVNEMILIRKGRKMFPLLKVKVSGLENGALYAMCLEFVQLSDTKLRYTSNGWAAMPNSRLERRAPAIFLPASPVQFGGHWSEEGVNFSDLKITNTSNITHPLVSLMSMCFYMPRLHIAEMRVADWSPRANIQSIDLKDCQFVAVTAYQNETVTKLKVENNPFARALNGNSPFHLTDEELAVTGIAGNPELHHRVANNLTIKRSHMARPYAPYTVPTNRQQRSNNSANNTAWGEPRTTSHSGGLQSRNPLKVYPINVSTMNSCQIIPQVHYQLVPGNFPALLPFPTGPRLSFNEPASTYTPPLGEGRADGGKTVMNIQQNADSRSNSAVSNSTLYTDVLNEPSGNYQDNIPVKRNHQYQTFHGVLETNQLTSNQQVEKQYVGQYYNDSLNHRLNYYETRSDLLGGNQSEGFATSTHANANNHFNSVRSDSIVPNYPTLHQKLPAQDNIQLSEYSNGACEHLMGRGSNSEFTGQIERMNSHGSGYNSTGDTCSHYSGTSSPEFFF